MCIAKHLCFFKCIFEGFLIFEGWRTVYLLSIFLKILFKKNYVYINSQYYLVPFNVIFLVICITFCLRGHAFSLKGTLKAGNKWHSEQSLPIIKRPGNNKKSIWHFFKKISVFKNHLKSKWKLLSPEILHHFCVLL